uniref:serine O-acetyltransferase n=1 Tax=Leptocylindrus danicus TaxID=163516 RepID=A0A7S2PMX6_9STRA|mmetsp:Transcript_5724/g.8439  ORF Transcript_5724/g.8439 Transcript_5724/m.8439 type:complete len:218 (+) Transcript_5724:3-656(+)
MRSPSVGDALTAILFNRGLHALVCHRVSHRLWKADRTGLAKYLQSTVSRIYQADIHPAATFGSGIYMNCGSGIVIGETAVVGDDVSILQSVTLGGTGKERGDRHPKVGRGVILQDGATVLGNIKVGDGAVITAKSIVTKEVPPLARVSGVPAKVRSYREAIADADNLVVGSANDDGEGFEYNNNAVDGDGDEFLERQMQYKYLKRWEAAHDNVDALK